MKSTPRAEFIKSSENVKQHNTLLANAAFLRAEDVATAEFLRAILTLGAGKDLDAPGAQQAAAASHYMMLGALHYQEVFHRLAEPYAAPKPKDKIESLTKE